jgi:hypothetical protein
MVMGGQGFIISEKRAHIGCEQSIKISSAAIRNFYMDPTAAGRLAAAIIMDIYTNIKASCIGIPMTRGVVASIVYWILDTGIIIVSEMPAYLYRSFILVMGRMGDEIFQEWIIR